MKKALLFLPYLAPYRIDVLNAMSKFYDLTVVFIFKNANEQKFNHDLLKSSLNIKIVYLDKGFSIYGRQIRTGVFRLLKQNKPDIVFSNEYGITSLFISLYSSVKLFKIKHISTTSDNYEMALKAIFLRKIARKMVLNTSDAIVVYNYEVSKFYKEKFKIETRVCPNIQNPKSIRFTNLNINDEVVKHKEKYGLDEKNNILYVGRLDKVKGLDLLIKAFSNSKTIYTKLILVGAGNQENELKKLAVNLGVQNRVIFTGRFDGNKLLAWYKIANIFVLPSLFEPFGAVVNEALIMGLPVLCSDTAGAKFYIKDGVNGYVFNPFNEEQFTNILDKSLHEFSHNNKNENLMQYDFNTFIKNYDFNT